MCILCCSFTIKNISAFPLNISSEQLTDRFVRGDEARSTEGSGLGLSIAQSLTELQGGQFQLEIDGDLFKVRIALPLWPEEE
jgi:signal transduction histidine kinase